MPEHFDVISSLCFLTGQYKVRGKRMCFQTFKCFFFIIPFGAISILFKVTDSYRTMLGSCAALAGCSIPHTHIPLFHSHFGVYFFTCNQRLVPTLIFVRKPGRISSNLPLNHEILQITSGTTPYPYSTYFQALYMHPLLEKNQVQEKKIVVESVVQMFVFFRQCWLLRVY